MTCMAGAHKGLNPSGDFLLSPNKTETLFKVL